MTQSARVVLVTGCSSGIGKSTALHLAARPNTIVVATARKVDVLKDLEAAGCRTVALDVTSDESVSAAVKLVTNEYGAVDVLVNNAGYCQSGAVEEVPLDRWRAQFETNVFGLVRTCQAVLPGMRAAGRGTIINVSSMGGKLTFPGGGPYHASKHAVEALSDALRFEVRGFGINVVVVQPGLIRTGFADAAVQAMGQPIVEGPYAGFTDAVAKATQSIYVEGPLAKLGGEGIDVARVIEKAMNAKRPKARYSVTASAKLMLAQRAMLGDGVWDAFLRSQFPQPGVTSNALAKAE